MTNKLQKRIRQLSLDLIHCPVGHNKHFTFLIDRNQIISIGWCNRWKTHPTAAKLGYRFSSIHSELDAVIRSRRPLAELSGITVVNTRLNSKLLFGMCKPCSKCLPLVLSLNPKNVYYTDFDGEWTKL